MSCSYGELQNTSSSLLPEPQIDIPAFFISGELFYGLAFIAVDLPASGTFKIPACIFNKADDIAQRIVKKNPDLMWESFSFQLGQTLL